jgi:hypothetical protein
VYEYLVGLHVNGLRRFYPIFPVTYALGTVEDPNPAEVAAFVADESGSLEALVAWGCDTNREMYHPKARLLTQFLPMAASLERLVRDAGSYGDVCELVATLHILYSALSSVANSFTHFDMHAGNVGVVAMPHGTYMQLTHRAASGTASYKTRLMPVVYDFGASVVPQSRAIMAAVCALKEACPKTCGDERGFRDEPGKQRVRRNITADTKAMYNVKHFLSENTALAALGALGAPPAFVTELTKLLEALPDVDPKRLFGYEVLSMATPGNVHAVFTGLDAIVRSPSFLAQNAGMYGGHAEHVHLRVWYGMHQPFATRETATAHDPPAHVQSEYDGSNGTVFFAEHASSRDDAVFRALNAGGCAIRPRSGDAFAAFRRQVVARDRALDATYWRVAYAGSVCNLHVLASAAAATHLTFRCGPDEPVTITKGDPELAGRLCAACDAAGEDVVVTIAPDGMDQWAKLGFELLDEDQSVWRIRRKHARASFGDLYTE